MVIIAFFTEFFLVEWPQPNLKIKILLKSQATKIMAVEHNTGWRQHKKISDD